MDVNPVEKNTEDDKLKLATEELIPVIAGGCTIDLLEGERTEEVKVLRDIGCELAAVRNKFVKEEQYLG